MSFRVSSASDNYAKLKIQHLSYMNLCKYYKLLTKHNRFIQFRCLMNKIKVLKFWISLINKYVNDISEYEIDHFPVVAFDETENDIDNIFIKTGSYINEKQTIVLYVSNRHIKDILRTYCHELIHHHQNLIDYKSLKTIMVTQLTMHI